MRAHFLNSKIAGHSPDERILEILAAFVDAKESDTEINANNVHNKTAYMTDMTR